MSVQRIETTQAAKALAERILDPHRSRPVVLVTTPLESTTPALDASHIAAELEGLADVCLVLTGEPTYALSDELPEYCGVYGGAGRVYPASPGDPLSAARAPLRLLWPNSDANAVARRLVDDAMAVVSASVMGKPADPGRVLDGVVQQVRADLATLRLDNGGQALVRPGTAWPSIDLPRQLRPRQSVLVRVVQDGPIPLVAVEHPSPAVTWAAVVRAYAEGADVLGQIGTVRRDTVEVLLHPDLAVAVPAELVDLDADPRDLLSEGDVVVARVVETSATGEPEGWVLSLAEAGDPDSVLPAIPLMEGGPPWLTPPPAAREPVAPPETEPSQEAQPRPAVPTPATVAAGVSRQVSELSRRLADGEQERERLDSEVHRLRAELRSRTQQVRRLERRLKDRDRARDALALDPEDAFRAEVYAEWLAQVPTGERGELPLRPYRIGPKFLSSLDAVEGISRSKVVQVVVEVLTGVVDRSPGRDVHRLREGVRGAYVTRDGDGASAWRAALQQNTAAARRLHYWRAAETIELSLVALHDEVRIA